MQGCTVDELKWIAELFPGAKPGRKGELVQFVANHLSSQAELQRLFGQLNNTEQQIVAEVIYGLGGRYDQDMIEAKYGKKGTPRTARGYDGSSIYGSFGRKKAEATPFDVLFCYNYNLGIFIPQDVMGLLSTFVPPPPESRVKGHDEVPAVTPSKRKRNKTPELHVFQGERAIFHDLAATLALVSQGKIAVSAATQLPTQASLRTLTERLLLPDYFGNDYARADEAMRPLALVLLVQAAKWASPGTGTKLNLTRSGQKLLSGSIGASDIRDAWERWLKSDLLDELSRVRGIKGQGAKGTRLTKASERRQKLAAMLHDAPVGQWAKFNSFLRHLRATRQLPAVERGDYSNLYIGYSRDSGWLGYSGIKYWDVVTGSILRVLLTEFAASLGMVDIAYTAPEESPHDFGEVYGLDDDYISRYDGLWAFRITELGAYVLGLREHYKAPEPEVEQGEPLLHILPNLDLVVTDPARLAPNERAVLERIGTVQHENVYRLSREQLLEASQHGLSLEQARAFLSNKSGLPAAEFPQTVTVFLADTEKRLNALREGGRMLLFEGDDPYLLTELANNSALRGLVRLGALEGRTVLLVPEEQETAARRALKKLGYVPRKQ
ncbi:MAG: helicase-associated domain-containing protein [Chloroflexaceae bacterium]|nr:helicase-associated domain-containing protein [Chloroflexaceae bacterium]